MMMSKMMRLMFWWLALESSIDGYAFDENTLAWYHYCVQEGNPLYTIYIELMHCKEVGNYQRSAINSPWCQEALSLPNKYIYLRIVAILA